MATNVEETDSALRDNHQTTSVNKNGKEIKKDKIPAGLLRRHEERLAKVEKMKEQRENEKVMQESAEYFAKTFNAERSSIEERLATANNVGKPKLRDFFDDITEAAEKLLKYMTDMTQFLPAYDIQSAQQSLGKLFESINERRDELLPKKKFAFKVRKRGDGQATKQQQTQKIGLDDVDASKSSPIITVNAVGFSNRTSESLSLPAEEIHQKDVNLSNLSSCTIKLPGSPSALQISNLSDCKVFCGPIPGSVFADKCIDSTLVLACQQLRVHNSRDSKFYLHVTSRAIIEDTNSVLYAPYNWAYDTLEKDYEESGLDKSKNSWNDVDDFNWLAHDKHSPNWGLIPDNERVQEWD
ncbi:tubulin-specific chaperone C-like [Lytechinus variegatus]|uniref:tubulin-specific chaperone C-like n=1 Tax=Lytechinus variegatus TaxID=7654 RepID=UPI001BB2A1DC|nr:tubulin-specific chaperone C-like [Lytechinus variegatus]